MKVFLAGATGAIGRPLLLQLMADGHHVTATTRSQERAETLRASGAQAVVLDAFDADAVRAAINAARPEVVIHQLTALPADASPRAMKKAMAQTARLRRETVPTFLEAARKAGARRFIAQSMCFVTRPEGPEVLDETAPIWVDGPPAAREAFEPIRDLESAVQSTEGLEGIVLRYGFFYGPGTWYAPDGTIGKLVRKRAMPMVGSGRGRQSFIHIDDAARATVLAMTRGAPGIYNVTDDDPATQDAWLPEIARLMGAKPPLRVPSWVVRPLAGPLVVHYATTLRGARNARARAAFAFEPRDWRTGFAQVFGAPVARAA